MGKHEGYIASKNVTIPFLRGVSFHETSTYFFHKPKDMLQFNFLLLQLVGLGLLVFFSFFAIYFDGISLTGNHFQPRGFIISSFFWLLQKRTMCRVNPKIIPNKNP